MLPITHNNKNPSTNYRNFLESFENPNPSRFFHSGQQVNTLARTSGWAPATCFLARSLNLQGCKHMDLFQKVYIYLLENCHNMCIYSNTDPGGLLRSCFQTAYFGWKASVHLSLSHLPGVEPTPTPLLG